MASEILSPKFETASKLELEDFIHERMLKAHALAANTYGASGEGFRGMNDDLQDNYLWALSDMLREANEAQQELVRRSSRRLEKDGEFIEIPVIGKANCR
jgi:hypothetical protein